MGRVKLSAEKSDIEGRGAYTVALAGNPNVGKSTLFNSLTGMHVHTGNWAGKTVGCEAAAFKYGGESFCLVDIPGTYSLISRSDEEKIARDYICFGGADLTVVVADACALEQNLNLVMQICECGGRVVVCVNLLDEAKKRGIRVDTEALSSLLSVPVVGVIARKPSTLTELCRVISVTARTECRRGYSPRYPDVVEGAAGIISEGLSAAISDGGLRRWAALRLVDAEGELAEQLLSFLSGKGADRAAIERDVCRAREYLYGRGIGIEEYTDAVVEGIVSDAERIAASVVRLDGKGRDATAAADRILTGRVSAYPAMLLLLVLVFFITLSLAKYPSDLLASLFMYAEEGLTELFTLLGAPQWLYGALVLGLFRTLGQVVAVMLPPMAIFFPLFALLEDSGYLPRVAYNLDRPFAVAGACGKQALTMCMGFGCNAVGICGCRIIDSRRERLLATLTNSLVPCNGRLPMMVTLISVVCLYFSATVSSVTVAAVLAALIVAAVAVTFGTTALLSRTVLRGAPSAFTIELPPYRRPQILKVILRSLSDKCLSVLLRAVAVAAPIGVLIWLLSGIRVGDGNLLAVISDFLSPVGEFFGMDGVILLAFIIGIPANEIVIPIMLMIYSGGGTIPYGVGLVATRAMFLSQGWTSVTAICTLIFALFHWPCSTSLITVYKETRSVRATLVAFLLPTCVGLILCLLARILLNLIGL